MKKFFLIAAGILVLAFLLLSSLGNRELEKQKELVRSLPEKSKAMSAEIFGAGFPEIEQVRQFGKVRHMLASAEHLDHPVKLRQFSERVCAIENNSHCYLIFYTSRESIPKYALDDADYVEPKVHFTINKVTGLNELSYTIESTGYPDNTGDLQKYFADHGKAWQ